ncbi:MAG: methyl-accepting chemotaxis protein [Fibromonadaceae bacterium]|jgi:methyl-accepting chemotaxis protein|nr:methyl-accepting chemotaxis protein [Fibromonadaceae bacterium]
MQLKYKIPLILFLAYFIIVSVLIAVTLVNSSEVHRDSQNGIVTESAKSYAEIIDGFMSARIVEIKSLERLLTLERHLSDKERLEMFHRHMYSLLSDSDSKLISDLYVTLERGSFFSAEATEEGRYFNIDCFRPETGGLELSDGPSETVEDDDDWYLVPQKTGRLHLTEPYKWKYPGEETERLMITLSSPVFLDGKFVGVIGMDMELNVLQRDFFDNLTDKKTGAFSTLISHEGLRVTHPNSKMWLTEIGDDLPKDEQSELRESISNGKEYSMITDNKLTGEKSIISFVPMKPKWLDLPWSVNRVVPLDIMKKDEIKVRDISIVIGLVSAVFWGIFLVWLMHNVFSNLTNVLKTLSKMTAGDGDLTIRLKEKGKDEIGQMSRGLNHLIEKLHSTLKTTQKEAKKLLDSSQELFELSHSLSKSSDAMLERTSNVSENTTNASEHAKAIASKAEQASNNTNELVSAAEQMSANMNSVAGAVEELSVSFREVASSSNESHMIATEAKEKASEATKAMNSLGEAAKEIGHVTNIIKKIADKTNLLALNATIEAASAGEAGKGFAVVAGEIKELANQSAESANDIANRIEHIQSGTNSAIGVINNVAEIISRINLSVDSIASSVGQQTKASNEIAHNTDQASIGVRRMVSTISEVASSVRDSAQNARNVANDIRSTSDSVDAIHKDAKLSSESSTKLENTADELKAMAENLDSIVGKFRT